MSMSTKGRQHDGEEDGHDSRWLAGGGSSAGRLRPGSGRALMSAGGGGVVVAWGRFSRTGAGGATRRMRATGAGSHQFQRPSTPIREGSSSDRMTTASRRIPAPRPVASTLTSDSGVADRARKARK